MSSVTSHATDLEDLHRALEEFHQNTERADHLAVRKTRLAGLIRDLMMILEFHVGQEGLDEILSQHGLRLLAKPFRKDPRSSSAARGHAGLR